MTEPKRRQGANRQAMENLFTEIDYYSNRKTGQDICGDAFFSTKINNSERRIAVLSDGLGSGIKANILATMTARMAAKFAASDLDFVHSAAIMMDTLPVCQVRKISYATFTIVDCHPHGKTRIIEMDNPPYLLIRDGRVVETEKRIYASPRWKTRKMLFSEVETLPDDRIVMVTDGITQAAMATSNYPRGFGMDGLKELVLGLIKKHPLISARELSHQVVRQVVAIAPNKLPHDDTTCGVVYFRKPRLLLLVTGPPFERSDDVTIANAIKDFDGIKIIAGGTTAGIIGRELDRKIEMMSNKFGCDLPPTSKMEGVDLVTEGVLTLTRVAIYLEAGQVPLREDPASQITNLLLDSDVIHMLVGSRINAAHYNPSMPKDLEIRRSLMRRIQKILEEKYLKAVTINFI